MSSTAYSAELHPESNLRQLVLASGALLGVLGIVMLNLISVSTMPRVFLGLAWLLLTGRELWHCRVAYSRNSILRISGCGGAEVLGPEGNWQPVDLCAGSIVLPRMAWLRISAASGLKYAELLRGNSRESEQWRRFQVIWRHVGAHR